MNRKSILVIFALICGAAAALAQVPQTMSHQGLLRDTVDGGIVDDGPYDMSFAIYTQPTGGSPIWGPEQHPAVQVEHGVFNVILGQGSPAQPLSLSFDQTYYLGIQVDPDPEFSERVELTTSPYSFRAAYADMAEDADWSITGDDMHSGLPGNVGIGTSSPNAKLHVVTDVGAGVFAEASSSYGGDFRTTSSNVGHAAVKALNLGEGPGAKIESDSDHGAWIISRSPDGHAGVYAVNDGAGHGIIGKSTSPSGAGVYGQASGGGLAGRFDGAVQSGDLSVSGFNMSSGASAGFVLTSDAVGDAAWQPPQAVPDGDWVISGSDMYSGVTGRVGIGTTFPETKLYVESDQISTRGIVRAEYNPTGSTGDTPAFYGKCIEDDWWGIGGHFEGGYTGVEGIIEPTGSGDGYFGVYGQVVGGSGTNRAVQGYASGGNTNYGVVGQAPVGGQNRAGMFLGEGEFTHWLTKPGGSFKIDHPLDPANKYLYHSFVESPDMKNIYDGVATLDSDGEVVVELPEWFEALNDEFRYQLTALGASAPGLYIAEEINDNRFRIAGGHSGLRVSWMVTGIRIDSFAKMYRKPVEEWKSEEEQGKYLHPEAFGLPETMGINSASAGRKSQ